MAQRFHASQGLRWGLDRARFDTVMTQIAAHGFLMEAPGGFIAGIAAENPISANWLIAKEFLWWAEDGSGPRLMRAFRRWARSIGADEIQWSCPPNARAERLYQRIGQKSEAVYSEYL